MQTPNRGMAIVAYLVPLIGALFVLIFNRKNLFAVYHAYQSLALVVAGIALPVGWAVVAWIVAWIPAAGAMISAALFALVIVGYLALVIAWFSGIGNAVQTKATPVPVYGGWGERFQQLAKRN